MARFQLTQLLHHQLGIKGVRMIVVQLAAFLVGHVVVALVVVVLIHHADLMIAEPLFQPPGQGRFAAAGAAGDAQQNNVHRYTILILLTGALQAGIFRVYRVRPTSRPVGV